MNAADCSIGNNPLAQFNKHAQNDKSLQHGSSLIRTPEPTAQQFKSSQNSMSDTAKFHMNNFMSGASPSNFQMRIGQQPKALSGSSSNAIMSSSVRELPGTPLQGNTWSQEFQTKEVPQMEHVPQQVGGPSYHYRGMGMQSMPMVTGPRMMMKPSIMSQQQQLSPQAADQSESWDEQFKVLEREVAENLHLQEKQDNGQKLEEGSVNQEDVVVEDQYQSEFQEVWDSLQKDSDDLLTEELSAEHGWENDYRRFLNGKDSGNAQYKFEGDNQFLHNPNAYEIGCLLMENGAKLSEAALAFEAAVQESPQHVDAWLKLGQVQTQNEKELSGINALEQCLKLDQHNVEAMKTLAISYINEGYDVSAFTMLNRWVEAKYPEMVEGVMEIEPERYRLNIRVRERFLHIANKLPQVDPDVQLCLGLLFYADDQFDKTIDCFKAALSVNPNDELMWNRLGASLANSSRSEEAIQAYHRALQLKPSFVRARYNLAVSSINIGCYREAAEHLLTALSMHEVAGASVNPSMNVDSNNILETLKRAFIAMDRRDLLEHVKPGMELNQFRGEFSF
ncbi:related to Peroxisomal targeting signal receptor [Zygosaccharomyces bailii ISA1307]|uniref:ZYBA0S07-01222g1_1 n=1 Tax=Zygosaccharomyces bailii (strain CLIB 213 / ATCC 58445 / CBS 680 / BCRC 21525 / NBRC 1098 / NCYC 1416 / NRRL Y-2227) TaxID=1333698 RepID=A0A8J2X918_ZYGB2|nr:ZYBA0S07-01222g1_1 [Zygosaccharomyces bailii CLIB 213]CDH10789.1 related to Peroxisomal targeting signal receptor [Zygosaccharomyces bailii ISA1307]